MLGYTLAGDPEGHLAPRGSFFLNAVFPGCRPYRHKEKAALFAQEISTANSIRAAVEVNDFPEYPDWPCAGLESRGTHTGREPTSSPSMPDHICQPDKSGD